jgi:pyridoxal phosphate enzyme (YggS family)
MLKEIKKNIDKINSSIRSENLFDFGTLIAVSKKKEYELIKEAYQNGIRDFGENYAQELNEKAARANEDGINISWHFIGPIQSNKISLIAKNAQWVHSISRLKEIEKLNDECRFIGKKMNVLLQVNISEEVSKSGIQKDNIYEFATCISSKRNLSFKGIMVMPKLYDDDRKTHQVMRECKKIQKEVKRKYPEASELSMGTTSDYKIAIACGSTMIRIGELIFGKRS